MPNCGNHLLLFWPNGKFVKLILFPSDPFCWYLLSLIHSFLPICMDRFLLFFLSPVAQTNSTLLNGPFVHPIRSVGRRPFTDIERVEWVGVRASQQRVRVRVRVQCGHTMCACDSHSGQSFTGHLSFCNIHFSLMMQPSS